MLELTVVEMDYFWVLLGVAKIFLHCKKITEKIIYNCMD